MNVKAVVLVALVLFSSSVAFDDVGPEDSIVVDSGRTLALALAKTSYGNITLANSIVLSDSDYNGLGPLPLLLTRNVTIAGPLDRQKSEDLITFDGSFVKEKVQLGPGVVLTLIGMVLTRYREDLPSWTPGMDLLAPSPPGADTAPEGPPMLLWVRIALNNRYCFPTAYFEKSVNATPRPAFWPGVQNGTRDVSQAGCVNDTSAHWLHRCWPARRQYNDIGTQAKAIGARGVPEFVRYYVRALDVILLCSEVMTKECFDTWGGLGCYYRYLPRKQPPPPSPSPAAVLAAVGAADGGAGGEQDGRRLGGIIGGVLGGAALLAVVASLAWVAVRRGYCGARRGSGPDGTAGNVLGTTKAVDPASSHDHSSGSSNMPWPPPDSAATGAAPEGAVSWFKSAAVAVDIMPPKAAAAAAAGPDGGKRLSPTQKQQQAPQSNDLQDKSGRRESGDASLGRDTAQRDSGDATAAASAGDAAAAAGARRPDPLMPLTAQTPHRPDMDLLGAGATGEGTDEVTLLSDNVRGKGSFGHVVEGIYKGQRVAVKLVADVHQWGGLPESLLLQFAQEVEVLGRCCHPNVVRLLAACLTPPRLCLVMELMETSLDRVLHRDRRTSLLPLPTVLHIAGEIARGLEYLHPTVVHRDLKPGNVLLSSSSSDRPIVKISDFGLSRLRVTAVPTVTPDAGTPAYLAPECFDASNFIITHQADIFSMAVVLWEMLAGEQPWCGCTVVEVAHKTVSLGLRLPLKHLPEARCPPKLKALITACWDRDPRRRPAAAEVAKKLALVLQDVEYAATQESGAGSSNARSSRSTGSTSIRVGSSVWGSSQVDAPGPAGPSKLPSPFYSPVLPSALKTPQATPPLKAQPSPSLSPLKPQSPPTPPPPQMEAPKQQRAALPPRQLEAPATAAAAAAAIGGGVERVEEVESQQSVGTANPAEAASASPDGAQPIATHSTGSEKSGGAGSGAGGQGTAPSQTHAADQGPCGTRGAPSADGTNAGGAQEVTAEHDVSLVFSTVRADGGGGSGGGGGGIAISILTVKGLAPPSPSLPQFEAVPSSLGTGTRPGTSSFGALVAGGAAPPVASAPGRLAAINPGRKGGPTLAQLSGTPSATAYTTGDPAPCGTAAVDGGGDPGEPNGAVLTAAAITTAAAAAAEPGRSKLAGLQPAAGDGGADAESGVPVPVAVRNLPKGLKLGAPVPASADAAVAAAGAAAGTCAVDVAGPPVGAGGGAGAGAGGGTRGGLLSGGGGGGGGVPAVAMTTSSPGASHMAARTTSFLSTTLSNVGSCSWRSDQGSRVASSGVGPKTAADRSQE